MSASALHHGAARRAFETPALVAAMFSLIGATYS
jgi:hypothetical protein